MLPARKWSSGDFLVQTDQARAAARYAYERVCRSQFDQPGFCVFELPTGVDSRDFRRCMLELTRDLANIHEEHVNQTLVLLSAVHFDQQLSTKAHLDGGPEESLLILGYEPTEVVSDIEISDYSQCAHNLGLSPRDFLATHNPMFSSGVALLVPFTTAIPRFSSNSYHIVCINNSSTMFDPERKSWQGTLHRASVPAPDENKRRVINSIMLARTPEGESSAMSREAIEDFATTDVVLRRGYDAPGAVA